MCEAEVEALLLVCRCKDVDVDERKQNKWHPLNAV